MPLYGHELGEAINPASTDLGFAIQLKDRDFVGRDAILAEKAKTDAPIRVGLEVEGRRPAREHCPIQVDGVIVGEVTSGTFSPTLQKPIAMGYLDPKYSAPGTAVSIDIRGKLHTAQVVKLPFYSRS